MDEKKLLNDEELDKVVGGADYWQHTRDGRIKILNDQYFACGSFDYFVDRRTGKPANEVPNLDVMCFYCKYYKRDKSGYCTNPDFIAAVGN